MSRDRIRFLSLVLASMVIFAGSLFAAPKVEPAGGGFLRLEDWRSEQRSGTSLDSHQGSVVYLKADSVLSVKVTAGGRVELISDELIARSEWAEPWPHHTVFYWEFTSDRGASDFAARIIQLIDEAERRRQ